MRCYTYAMSPHRSIALILLCLCSSLRADPTTQVGHFPHIAVDVKNKQIRVDCEALHCEAPLEFFCVTAGGNEHESVIRTRAKPSQIHTALLMLGLQPGEPVKYSESDRKWFPPHGPPLKISIEYVKDGKQYSMPAYKLMRDVHTKQTMPPLTWVFTGSRVMEDGTYAADITSYVVSIVNFDLTLIDIPALASSANETLEWETNLDLLPPLGSPMTMIIEPATALPGPASSPATRP
jgi:hypothetical protein